jgi:multidrug transporter EmrE-like cation transporter
MSTRKKALLLNTAWLIGIAVSLFIVPPSTPLALWSSLGVLGFVVLNYAAFRRRKTASGLASIGVATAVSWMGVLLLILDLIARYFFS